MQTQAISTQKYKPFNSYHKHWLFSLTFYHHVLNCWNNAFTLCQGLYRPDILKKRIWRRIIFKSYIEYFCIFEPLSNCLSLLLKIVSQSQLIIFLHFFVILFLELYIQLSVWYLLFLYIYIYIYTHINIGTYQLLLKQGTW